MLPCLPPSAEASGRPLQPDAGLFDAVPNVADWNVAAPRLAASVDLRGDGRTVLKASYGIYWLPPGLDLGFNVNRNGRVWWQRFKWADANGDRLWQPGEEFDLLETRGGESEGSIDSNLDLAYFASGRSAWIRRPLPASSSEPAWSGEANGSRAGDNEPPGRSRPSRSP